MRPGCEDSFDLTAAEMFEDPDSDRHQSAKFKLEGVFRSGLFRSSKAYYLEDRTEDDLRSIVRMRGVPRKHQRDLQKEHFMQDPLANVTVVRSVAMMPTPSMQVVMLRQGKTLSHSLNIKRVCTVREQASSKDAPLTLTSLRSSSGRTPRTRWHWSRTIWRRRRRRRRQRQKEDGRGPGRTWQPTAEE